MKEFSPIVLLFILPSFLSYGKDFGQVPNTQVWPIGETSLLQVMLHELKRAEQNGKVEKLNHRMAKQLRHRFTDFRNDTFSTTEKTTTHTFDPTMTVVKTIRDGAGNVLVEAGSRINPLKVKPLHEEIWFVDGDSKAQVDFVLSQSHQPQSHYKIILVRGNPHALSTKYHTSFYVDQGRKIAEHFGINTVPTCIKQEGLHLTMITYGREVWDD